MNCCVQCFQESKVTSKVTDFIEKRGEVGDCEFCGAKGVKIIQARKLGMMFEPLLELYEPAHPGVHLTGQSLADCLEEWEIFSEALDANAQNALLDEVMFGNLSPKDFSVEHTSSEDWGEKDDNLYTTGSQAFWDNFADYIKRKRRFLPKPNEFDFLHEPKDWLPDMLDAAALDVTEEFIFFRARLGFHKEIIKPPKALPAKEMGAPEAEIATGGRANPAGIPYLYVAEQEATAVAEIRPHVGCLVTIARVKPKKTLKLADLTKIHSVLSPFGVIELASLVRRNALLNILNEELARPINPKDCDVEYVPTQYLGEVIHNAGYDGIRYKSAIRPDGTNAVFFKPYDLEIQADTRLVEVRSVEVEYR